MTSAAVTAATTPLPRPRAIDGAVENDISNRTLIVRRPKHIAGYEAFMWRQAHEALALYEERGRVRRYAVVWLRGQSSACSCNTWREFDAAIFIFRLARRLGRFIRSWFRDLV